MTLTEIQDVHQIAEIPTIRMLGEHTSPLWGNGTNKVIHRDISTTFLSSKSPALSLEFISPATFNESFPQQLFQSFFLPAFNQLHVNNLLQSRLLVPVVIGIRRRRPINRRPPEPPPGPAPSSKPQPISATTPHHTPPQQPPQTHSHSLANPKNTPTHSHGWKRCKRTTPVILNNSRSSSSSSNDTESQLGNWEEEEPH